MEYGASMKNQIRIIIEIMGVDTASSSNRFDSFKARQDTRVQYVYRYMKDGKIGWNTEWMYRSVKSRNCQSKFGLR